MEHIAQLDAEALGFEKQLLISTGTDNILGMEINEYAAELARVTVWIGDIQWCQRNGRQFAKNPILHGLNGIQHKDALLNPNGTETKWAKADVIVGNPPFLGGSKKRGELGDMYFEALAKAYPKSRVPAGADLVCYWFDKARVQIEQGKTKVAGFVSTNSIRGGANRTVLDNICKTMPIFEAWTDEDWFDANTMVWVSMVCFGKNELGTTRLNGESVTLIHADLTAGDSEQNMDLTSAKPIKENAGVSFQGSQKIGAFDISGELARQWLKLPNPNNKANSLVLKPSWNGIDITRQPRDGWIIDFGTSLSEEDAALYEAPFEYVVKNVKPERETNNREGYRKYWWRHGEPRIAMRAALADLPRYIATSAMTKHCIFVMMNGRILPDKALIIIARSDDTTFGILHSRFHQLWALRLGSSMGNAPRYTPTTCFETFPFPTGLTPADTALKVRYMYLGANSVQRIPYLTTNTTPKANNKTIATFDKAIPAPVTDPDILVHAKAIAEAALNLNQLREKWLNPTEWVEWVITPEEESAGFPKRPKAKAGREDLLKKRTLTNLYNDRPTWLNNAHQTLDKAVANAYGWTDYTHETTDADILQCLLKLNLTRG